MRHLVFAIIRVLLVVGVVVFCVGMFVNGITNYQTYKNKGVDIEATVTDIRYYSKQSDSVYVRYEYEGQVYEKTIRRLRDETKYYQAGDVITVCINSDRPTEIIEGATQMLILGIIVPFFILANLIAIVYGFLTGKLQVRRR